MKKLLVLFALVGISFLGYSQDVKVNINNQDASIKDDCPYRINGICSTEDIGGVDVIIDKYSSGRPTATFTNYNPFPVTVLYECDYNRPGSDYSRDHKTGTIVIGVEGQKEVYFDSRGYKENWSVIGIIVRKLAQQ